MNVRAFALAVACPASAARRACPYDNVLLYTAGSWRANPLDVCAAFPRLRRGARGSDQRWLVEHALGAQAAQPNVRGRWNRVRYKGDSLASAANGYSVLTHAGMLENLGEVPHVVVSLSNDGVGIEPYPVQPITARLPRRGNAATSCSPRSRERRSAAASACGSRATIAVERGEARASVRPRCEMAR